MWLPAVILQWGLLLSWPGVAHRLGLQRIGESCPPAVWGHHLWASNHLHRKEPSVQLGMVFPHQWCLRVRKVRGSMTWSCAGTGKGRQCPKLGWNSRCCCNGACWLALPCIAGSSSSLVLSSSARAVELSVCSEVNPQKKLLKQVFFSDASLEQSWSGSNIQYAGYICPGHIQQSDVG